MTVIRVTRKQRAAARLVVRRREARGLPVSPALRAIAEAVKLS